MTKHAPATRLTALLNTLRWKGQTNWLNENSRYERLACLEWLQCVLPHVQPLEVRQTLAGYYFENATGDVSAGYYRLLEQGRVALATLYAFMEITDD